MDQSSWCQVGTSILYPVLKSNWGAIISASGHLAPKGTADHVVAAPSILFPVGFGSNLQAAQPFLFPVCAIKGASFLFLVWVWRQNECTDFHWLIFINEGLNLLATLEYSKSGEGMPCRRRNNQAGEFQPQTLKTVFTAPLWIKIPQKWQKIKKNWSITKWTYHYWFRMFITYTLRNEYWF